MQAIIDAIQQDELLDAALRVAEQVGQRNSRQAYQARVGLMTEQMSDALAGIAHDQDGLTRFLNYFYRHLAFSGREMDALSSKHCLIQRVIDYRTGIPVTLGILLTHFAKALGFNASCVNFPGHFLVSFSIDEDEPLYVDPLNGNSLSVQALESMYCSVMEEEEDEMPANLLEPAKSEDVIIRLLNNLKASFMLEQQFQYALVCVDLLILLCPNDPYERRDRGFLLHQLDCPQMALADYQYFIRHCPQDPAAQLLKIQLRHLHNSPPVVLH